MSPCVCCKTKTPAMPLMFTVRGTSGQRYQGLIIVRGRIICDGCCRFFYGV